MEEEQLNFLPYLSYDGIPTLKDSDIGRLYEACRSQNILDIVFHDDSINTADEFIEYVKRSDVIFFSVQYNNLPFGFFWLNRLERTNAHIHFAIFSDYWGTGLSIEAGRKAVETCLGMYPTIMGRLRLDNEFALDYARRLGFRVLGFVPNLIWDKTADRPAYGIVVYITKECLK